MHDFDYGCPTSTAEACHLAAQEDAKVLAGGMTLLPACKQRLAKPSLMIDLSGLEDLVGIELKNDSVSIGAMTTRAYVAKSGAIQSYIPAHRTRLAIERPKLARA
jgi:carbon-monoxide dehydrogenase medium subunit